MNQIERQMEKLKKAKTHDWLRLMKKSKRLEMIVGAQDAIRRRNRKNG